MQIADGIVVLGKEHEQPKYDVTPAEAIILHKLHFSGSKGIPLKNFVIKDEEAMVEVGSKREKVKRENLAGEMVDAEINVPIRRKRTAQEELVRLRRAYPGTVKHEGRSAPVVEVCFPGHVKHLPQTFAEIEGELPGIGPGFFKPAAKASSQPEDGGNKIDPAALDAKRIELMKETKPDLIELATKMEIAVEQDATKAMIVEKILAKAQANPAATV